MKKLLAIVFIFGLLVSTSVFAQDHLLISEFAVSPTVGEFIESRKNQQRDSRIHAHLCENGGDAQKKHQEKTRDEEQKNKPQNIPKLPSVVRSYYTQYIPY